MILRAEHVAAMAEAAREIFVDRVTEHVDRDRATVSEYIATAEDIGFASEAGIVGYVELCCAGFDAGDPRHFATFGDGSLTDEERLAALAR